MHPVLMWIGHMAGLIGLLAVGCTVALGAWAFAAALAERKWPGPP